MKAEYRGYEIDCSREESLGAGDNLYFSVYRISDGLEVVASFTEGDDTEADYIGYMQSRVDEFIRTRGASEYLEDEYQANAAISANAEHGPGYGNNETED